MLPGLWEFSAERLINNKNPTLNYDTHHIGRLYRIQTSSGASNLWLSWGFYFQIEWFINDWSIYPFSETDYIYKLHSQISKNGHSDHEPKADEWKAFITCWLKIK